MNAKLRMISIKHDQNSNLLFFIIASKTFLMQYAATFFPGGVVYEIAQMQQRKGARVPKALTRKERKRISEKAHLNMQ